MFDFGLGALIDLLRQRGDAALADIVQFGVEGLGRWDGHRCRICDQLAGRDPSHRCWDEHVMALPKFELKARTIPQIGYLPPRHTTEIHRGTEGPFILGGYPAELDEDYCPYHGKGLHIVGYNQSGYDGIAFCLRCCAELLMSETVKHR
jgi:hypothetical protein